ncbi:MAG: FKBP-type peptidyl-prolyl cis-trans isomerase [Gammaproteobacteria bacterium]|nr:MAG: FKBP-type peptidyl-prolyl cis-trans isomerase [Gammaproteobacteria bacterium]
MINKKLAMIGLMASAALVVGCKEDAKKQDDGAKLQTLEQKASYIIGQGMGKQFKQSDFNLETDSFVLAINDLKAGTPARISEEESQKIMQELTEGLKKKQEEKAKQLSETNKTAGEKFLAENKTKEGVQTTASGLQYKVITAGNGVKPKATDTVKVHYEGKLLDGTVFDSSIKRGEPVEFPVNGVIPGWVEALQLMPQGSKWEVYIPSDLAYGPTGQGPTIPPASTLIFTVELLEVKAPAAEPAPTAPAKPAKK